MVDELNLTPEQPQSPKPRKRRTGLRIIVLLVLVAVAATLSYVDLGFLFRTPKNTAEVEIPKADTGTQAPMPGQTGGQNAMPAPDGGQTQSSLAENPEGGLAASDSATRLANATIAPNAMQNATQTAGQTLGGTQGRAPTTVEVGGGRTAEVGAVIPPVKSDATVTPRFITDLAESLVDAYYPKGTHPAAGNTGISILGLKSLNLRYGGALVGLNRPVDDPAERRKFVLRYVMMPSMIRALYSLYGDAFINTMLAEAAQLERTPQGGSPRKISAREQAEMFGIYAAHTRTLSAIFRACAADREISKHMQAYWDAEKATQDADLAFQTAQEARERSRADASIDFGAAKAETDKTGSAYRSAVIRRENARSALISVLRGHPGVRGLGDDQMLYAVAWVQRRLQDIPNALNSLDAAGNMLDNLAGRMEALSSAK